MSSSSSPAIPSSFDHILLPLKNSPKNITAITPSIKILKSLSKSELEVLLNDKDLLTLLEPIFLDMVHISDAKHLINVCDLLKSLPVSKKNLKSSSLLKSIMSHKKSAKNFQLKKQLNTIVFQWKSSASGDVKKVSPPVSPPKLTPSMKRKFSQTSMASSYETLQKKKKKKRLQWSTSLESIRVFEVNRNPVRVEELDFVDPPFLSVSLSEDVMTPESKKYAGPLRPHVSPSTSSPKEPSARESRYAESDVPSFPTTFTPPPPLPSPVQSFPPSSLPFQQSMSSIPSNMYQQLQQQHSLYHSQHSPNPSHMNYGYPSQYYPSQQHQQPQHQPPYGFQNSHHHHQFPASSPPPPPNNNPYGFQSPPLMNSQPNSFVNPYQSSSSSSSMVNPYGPQSSMGGNSYGSYSSSH